MCAKWPDHRAFSRISLPLSGEEGKGNLSWHVFVSGEATYARTEGKHHPVRKVLKHLFSHSHQKVEMMQRQALHAPIPRAPLPKAETIRPFVPSSRSPCSSFSRPSSKGGLSGQW